MLPTKFQVNWPFGSGEKAKIDFQDCHHGCHLGFLFRTILAIFDLQVTLMLPTKLLVNSPFGSGEKAKIDFQDGRHGSNLGFPIGTTLAFFFIYKSPRCFLQSFKSIGQLVNSGEEAKNRFSRWPP